MFEVVHSRPTKRGIKEAGAEEFGGFQIHLKYSFAGNALVFHGIAAFLGKGESCPIGKILHRVGKIQVLHLLNEGDSASSGVTAEAEKHFFGG